MKVYYVYLGMTLCFKGCLLRGFCPGGGGFFLVGGGGAKVFFFGIYYMVYEAYKAWF